MDVINFFICRKGGRQSGTQNGPTAEAMSSRVQKLFESWKAQIEEFVFA